MARPLASQRPAPVGCREKLQEIGITAAQAQLQLGKLRMERRGRATSACDPRGEYRDMLYAALDEDVFFDAAFASVEGGAYLARRPALRSLLSLVRAADDARDAANDLLFMWCCASAQSWAMGGSGVPLAFIVSRQQSALPLFQ